MHVASSISGPLAAGWPPCRCVEPQHRAHERFPEPDPRCLAPDGPLTCEAYEPFPEPDPRRLGPDFLLPRADEPAAPLPAPTPPENARAPYAVDPIGGPVRLPDAPPPAQEVVRAINWLEVTNLGTLLDVVA